MMKKVKAFFGKVGKKGKALVASAVAMMSAVSMTAIASADEVTSATESVPDYTMATMLSDAGDKLIQSFGDLVMTMIPVIMGILGTGLTVFGIFALIKLAKKIFGKVAG